MLHNSKNKNASLGLRVYPDRNKEVLEESILQRAGIWNGGKIITFQHNSEPQQTDQKRGVQMFKLAKFWCAKLVETCLCHGPGVLILGWFDSVFSCFVKFWCWLSFALLVLVWFDFLFYHLSAVVSCVTFSKPNSTYRTYCILAWQSSFIWIIL